MAHPNILFYLLFGELHTGQRGLARGAEADSNKRADADTGATCTQNASYGRAGLLCIFFLFAKSSGPTCPTYVEPRNAGELDSATVAGEQIFARREIKRGEVRVIL